MRDVLFDPGLLTRVKMRTCVFRSACSRGGEAFNG